MTFSKNSIFKNKDFVDGFDSGRYQAISSVENMIRNIFYVEEDEQFDFPLISISKFFKFEEELKKMKGEGDSK